MGARLYFQGNEADDDMHVYSSHSYRCHVVGFILRYLYSALRSKHLALIKRVSDRLPRLECAAVTREDGKFMLVVCHSDIVCTDIEEV